MPLSERASQLSRNSHRYLVYDVLKDHWVPGVNPLGYVNLGLAENSLMHKTLSDHIHKNLLLPIEAFTYGDGSKLLKTAMSHFFNKRWGPAIPVEPAHITVTNGLNSALEHISWTLAGPGDVFLLGQPHYGSFIPGLTIRLGARVSQVSFKGVDPLGMEAVRAYEDKLIESRQNGCNVAGLVLCNPHNPLGRCYPREVLVALMRLCQKYQIHLISDEIYALSVFPNAVDASPPPTPFTSCLSINTTGLIDESLLYVLWGMSKDFGANGIRIGAIISQNNPLFHEALIPLSFYSSTSSLSEHITINLLNDEAWTESYIAENQRKLAACHVHASTWARDNDIPYATGVNAGFFLWVNLGIVYKRTHPGMSGDINSVVNQALLKQKVFLASGANFGSEEPGWFRIVFSHGMDYLDEGLKRIIAAII
ncbi:pyridoxal phosphate-dependent transferase [Ilyonectria sp. MPI-CAGE-AT-0026]|nr:pyridoxal phosphate-dependent transferase [Ilyonectria sp. MPI-CAGE-AT-0026]